MGSFIPGGGEENDQTRQAKDPLGLQKNVHVKSIFLKKLFFIV
jgi:hypothetical protein